MSGRRFNPAAMRMRREVKVLEGTIQILANATVDTANSDMAGFTCARTGTGLYTITPSDPFASVASWSVDFGAAAAVNLDAQLVSQSGTSLVFRIHASGVATDPSAVCFVSVLMNMHNSTQKV